MGKPRIIIADTDVNYIIPLELKFIEEFFEKIDLEIITDKELFHDFFSSPQQADILIVCEELYSTAIQRHNLSNIFLMTEVPDEEKAIDSNINCIFKYTSIKEIFSEIIVKSRETLNMDTNVKRETQVILVYSASEDIGRTAVAMGISSYLMKNYNKVLYLNASHMQVFQQFLDNENPITSVSMYTKLSKPSDYIYNEIKEVICKDQFEYLPPFKASLMSLGLKFSIYEKIILSAKISEDYDYIIVDTDATFNEDKAQLFGISDKVIIVTGQTESAIYATNMLLSNVTGMSDEKYVFVCNNYKESGKVEGVSSTFATKYTVSDYFEFDVRQNKIKCTDFMLNKGIQKIAFLVM